MKLNVVILSIIAVPVIFAAESEKLSVKNPSEEFTLMPELIVTASRSQESAFLLPYTTDVISEKEIIEYNQRTIPEALELVPGVLVQKTTYGHGSPYVRGFTGRQNLLLIDGIRMNNSTWRSGPSQYWNTLDAFSLSQMELVKGQGSVLYGSDSVGGTLNVRSQSSGLASETKGQAFNHGMMLYRYGTNGNNHTARLEFNTGVGGEFGLHLGITSRHFGDIRDGHSGRQAHTGYDELDYDLKAEWMVNEKNTLTVASRTLTQDDIWRTHKTIFAESWHGTSIGNAEDFHYDQRQSVHYVQLAGNDLAGGIQCYNITLSYLNSKENEFSRVKSVDSLNKTWVDTLGIVLQAESLLPLGSIVYGADYYYDYVSAKAIKKGKTTTPVLSDGSTYHLLGAFAEHKLPLDNDTWELRTGTRLTYAHATLAEVVGNKSDISKDWANVVFSERASYKINSEWNLFAGISQAFRAPNLDDLGANQKPAQTQTFVNGNPNLDPEKYLTYEIGTHVQDKELSWEVCTYFTQMKDVVVQRPLKVENGNMESVASNASDGWVTGVESSLVWKMTSQWTLSSAVGWIYGEAGEYPYTNSLDGRDNYISRLAPLTANMGIRWDNATRDYWVEMRITVADKADKLNSSDVRDTSRIPPTGTPGYYWISCYAGWNIVEGLEWITAFENITDQRYRLHGSGLNEPGFGIVSTLKWSW